MIKELRQIDKEPVIGKPVATKISTDTLYFYYKRKALEAVNTINHKICGKIKVITCADVSEQKIPYGGREHLANYGVFGSKIMLTDN